MCLFLTKKKGNKKKDKRRGREGRRKKEREKRKEGNKVNSYPGKLKYLKNKSFLYSLSKFY